MNTKELISACEKAREEFQAGQYREVISGYRAEISALKNASKKDEQSAALLLIYARALLAMEEFEEASELLQKSIDSSANSAEAQFELALLKHKQGELSLRELIADLRLRADSLHHKDNYLYMRVLIALGRALLAEGSLAMAETNFRQAFSIADTYYKETAELACEPLAMLALVYLKQEKHTLAAALARDAVSHVHALDNPLQVEALLVIARASEKLGLLTKAVLAAERAYDLALRAFGEEHSLFGQALATKATVLRLAGDFEKAQPEARLQLEILEKRHGADSPELIEPLCDLAHIYSRLGERTKAEAHFERALALLAQKAQSKPFDSADGEDLSTCYKEYSLLEDLSSCYLWQGKIADCLRLVPSSMRAKYTCQVDSVVSVINSLSKRLKQYIDEQSSSESQ